MGGRDENQSSRSTVRSVWKTHVCCSRFVTSATSSRVMNTVPSALLDELSAFLMTELEAGEWSVVAAEAEPRSRWVAMSVSLQWWEVERAIG